MPGEAHNVLAVSISGKSSRRGKQKSGLRRKYGHNLQRNAGRRSPEPLGNVTWRALLYFKTYLFGLFKILTLFTCNLKLHGKCNLNPHFALNQGGGQIRHSQFESLTLRYKMKRGAVIRLFWWGRRTVDLQDSKTNVYGEIGPFSKTFSHPWATLNTACCMSVLNTSEGRYFLSRKLLIWHFLYPVPLLLSD